MPSMDPIFNEITATTKQEMRNNTIYECFFVDTPLQQWWRSMGAIDSFPGGAWMQTPFTYGKPQGGGVSPGQTVPVLRQQIVAATSFQEKAYATWFSVDDFEMGNGVSSGVINTGPDAAVDLYTVFLESCTSNLNTMTEMDWYHHGQPNSATVTDNRILVTNGASEACNDGLDPSWDGNVFPTYGGQTRNGAINNALNSIPQWAGNPDGSAGQISYEFLSQSYTSALHRPQMGIVSTIGYTYIASLFQRQQRFDILAATRSPITWKGISFEDAIIYQDWLAPSAVDPAFLPVTLTDGTGHTNQTGTFTVPTTVTAASKLPVAGTVCTVGETLFWVGSDWKWRPTTDPAWYFGIRRTSAYDNVSLDAIFMRLALTSYCGIPRDSIQVYGYSS